MILAKSLSTPLVVGLSGATRNASATLCTADRVLGMCPQERTTRVRGAGFNATGLPDEALDELLRCAGRRRQEITTYALAEPGSHGSLETTRLDHHHAHACTAFWPSGFDSASILVCDHEPPFVSVWRGSGQQVNRVEWPWQGSALANLYSEGAELLGFKGADQRMEAMARLYPRAADWATPLFAFHDDRLEIAEGWRARVAAQIGKGSPTEKAQVAAALQSRMGDLFIDMLTMVKRRGAANRHVCLGGSLFYNSYFNSRAKLSGVFDEVFVPMDPGNAGLSLGTAAYVGRTRRQALTPFLGPSYSPAEIKETLDNCKLTYRWVSEADAIAVAVDTLAKGRLVAWFEGAMECGPRALGARSILASPFCTYVLDNLNHFLKHREPWRGYALSGLDSAVKEHFDGPAASPFMECDYTPKDRTRLKHVLPASTASVRVHTVGSNGPPQFKALLRAFGESNGYPILVNTSFNGFHEPIVCNPRDALRVFYGSGIDVLVFGQFVLSK